MTDDERNGLADKLFALVFSLRPDSSEKGQAWVLAASSAALARAILASVGPRGDTETLLVNAAAEVRRLVEEAQLRFQRERLTASSRPVN